MVTVVDMGSRKTTRRMKKEEDVRQEHQARAREPGRSRAVLETEEVEKTKLKKTSQVKTASTKEAVLSSPKVKNLKRLKPRNLSRVSSPARSSPQCQNFSPRKSNLVQQLVSKWETFQQPQPDSSSTARQRSSFLWTANQDQCDKNL